MDDAHWERAKEIFEDAADLSGAEREACLRDGCRGDAALRAEVERLLEGHDRAGDFLAAPAFYLSPSGEEDSDPPATPAFSPGEVISGRFEIIRCLGRGGMGEVYEARDSELGERVALKTIRAQISSDSRTLARFKQEIQLARRVTHPNVCRIFDIEWHRGAPGPDGVSHDFTFLSMELLTGETLAEAIRRRGRFSPAEALPVIRQMAAALAAAHSAGVIHRDFKPSNVMLVPGFPHTPPSASSSVSQARPLRAVVTDFGLARLSPAQDAAATFASTLTGPNQVLGTLAYMAPEQVEGGGVTSATDIYALGLVVFEMLTGALPYADGSSSFSVFRRMKEPPPSLLAAAPGLELAWDAAIRRSLDHQAAARFSSADEFITALTGGSDASEYPAAARRFSRPHFPSGTRHLKPRPLVAGISMALLAIVILIFFSVRHFSSGFPSQVPPGSKLLLTEIENDSHDPDFDSVTQLVRNQLSQSSFFNLMEPQRIDQLLTQMVRSPGAPLDARTAREVALRDSVPLIVFGGVSRVADDFRLDLKLERMGSDPDYPDASWQFSESASSKKEFFDVIRHAGVWIRSRAGESAADITDANRRPQDITTDSWEALSMFTQAQKLAAQDRYEDAVLVFQEAIEKDPQFAMAYMRLGDLLDSMGRDSEGYAYWKKALSLEGSRRLTRREELRIKGMYASDTGDLAAAVEAFSQYSIAFPGDYLGPFFRAYPLMYMGRIEEATQLLQKAQSLAPENYTVPDHLARAGMIQGNYDDSARYAARVRQLGQSPYADQLQGEIDFLKGDYDGARRLFASLRNSDDVYLRSVSYSLEACVLAELGRYAEAIQSLNVGIASDVAAGDATDRADKWLGIAYLQFKLGKFRDARSAALNSLALEHSIRRSADAGSLLARAGFVADANRILAALPSGDFPPISEVARLRLRGEILLAQGRKAEALGVLRTAHSKDQEVKNANDYFARALAGNGLPGDALAEYSDYVLHPGYIWYRASAHFPGLATDFLFSYASLAIELHKPDAPESLQRYLALRGGGDSNLPDLQRARELAGQAQVSRAAPLKN
jgi:eukaryotic-like serine/threonine-protein kinase